MSSIQHSEHLFLVSNHPAFIRKVSEFVELVQLNRASILRMTTLVFALLLPNYPPEYQQKMAHQMVQGIIPNEKVTNADLMQLLLRLASYSVENLDVFSTIAWLEIIKTRITDAYIINAFTGKQIKINHSFKLEFFAGENVLNECKIQEKHHRQEIKHIYFEEKVHYEQNQFNVKSQEVVQRQLKKAASEVIPWGYVCECYLHELSNNNFQSKHIYKLRSNNRLTIQKMEFWVEHNEQVSNSVRDFVVNQQTFSIMGVLSAAHLPQVISPAVTRSANVFRLNQAYRHATHMQKLKINTASESKYCNVLSDFIEREEFNLDQLNLTREKLIVRRKESLLGIAGKETIRKHPKNYDEEIRLFGETVFASFSKFHDQNRALVVGKNIHKALKGDLEEDANILKFMQRHMPQNETPQTEPVSTFAADLIQLAKKIPLQIMVVGRGKQGKTCLAKELSKQYGTIHISVEGVIQKLFERVKFFEQNPPEQDEDGNIKGGLEPLQKYILKQLNEGKCCQDEDLIDLVNKELESDLVKARGFILDLPFEVNPFWTQKTINNSLVLPKIGCRFVTHVIYFDRYDKEQNYFLTTLLEKDAIIMSDYDRKKYNEPKEEEDTQKLPPLIEANMIKVKRIQQHCSLDQILQQVQPCKLITIKQNHENPLELALRLRPHFYHIPIARKLQGTDKQLLSVGLDQLKLTRKWSPWGTTDCVELTNQKLIFGKNQFAAEYAGRVFLFQNENNLSLFLASPRKYLTEFPSLPKSFNLFITGPRKSGKKTIAHLLSEIYPLKVVDLQEILSKVIEKQRTFQSHLPSNFDMRCNSIHLSQGQFKEFCKGNGLSDKDILPIIFHELKIKLQKKPLNWGQEKTQEQGGQTKQPQQKKVPQKKIKKKERGGEQERPKTPPPQDLSLRQIIPELNYNGKMNEIRGYIFIGMPSSEPQLNIIKSWNIPIDKLIVLSDATEQNPNKRLQQRLSDAEIEQVTVFQTNFGPVKEALGEEVCKQVFIDKEPQQIVNKIRQLIDPFTVKTDEDSLNKVLSDKQEDGDAIALADCGQYCPVCLKDGFLIKGKAEFQSGLQGRRFKCAGQSELISVKQNPSAFCIENPPTLPPRILFMGVRGVGLKTQLLQLNHLHKIPILNFKDTILQQLEHQKVKRKVDRYYRKGFRKPQFDEEGKQIEDPQLKQQSADFDRKACEIKVTKHIFEGIKQIFINGNFFDVDEEKVSIGLIDLLAEARRLPQKVIILTAEESSWLSRVLDRKAITIEVEKQQAQKRKLKAVEREQERQKALQSGEQYQQTIDEEEIINIEEVISQRAETLKAQREADNAKLEEFAEAFKSWNIDVVTVQCDRDTKHVTDRLNCIISSVLINRPAMWHQNKVQIVEKHRVQDFIKNFIVKQSRFQKSNPFTLVQYPNNYPLIYNDRVYYLKSQEQRQKVSKNPLILATQNCSIKTINTKFIVLIIGLPKTGKTSLSIAIGKKLGFSHITTKKVLQQFALNHIDYRSSVILNQIKNGKTLSDEALIDLLLRRITMADCNRGIVLDGVINNKNQCKLLTKYGIIPTLIIELCLQQLQIKKRIAAMTKNFDTQIDVVHQRIQTQKMGVYQCKDYYLNKYNNLLELSASLSKWSLLETSLLKIEQRIRGVKILARELAAKSATDVSNVSINFNCIIENLSEYLNYCPLSFKIRRQYVKINLRSPKNMCLFNRKFYVFCGKKELEDFLINPQTFSKPGLTFKPAKQVQIEQAFSLLKKIEHESYCAVQLSRNKLLKSNSFYCVHYKSKVYGFASKNNMEFFIKKPHAFELFKLPDKLAIEVQKKSDLKKIAKRNDSSAFLEHHLSNIMMRSLAQLGYRRPKYPTLSSKQSALKFLAISLKANNPNKDQEYRQKYAEKLQKFINECNYSQDIREELRKKAAQNWGAQEEQNLKKICENYHEFLKSLEIVDKNVYFSAFIR